MNRRVDVFAAAALVLAALLTSSGPALAQQREVIVQGYYLDRLISVEGDVLNFAWSGSFGQIHIQHATEFWAAIWFPSSPQNTQGITQQTLKRRDRVIITGHPSRSPGGQTKRVLVRSITRPADGWKWSEGELASTAAPAGTAQSAPAASPSKVPAAGAVAGAKPAPAGTPSPGAPAATPAPPASRVGQPGNRAPAERPATAATPVTKTPPQQTETLAERQAKINQDVTAKTNSILANLKKKAEVLQGQSAAAQPSAAQGPSPGASAGPAWQPCGGELRSGASQTVTPVEFVNTSKQPRKLYWFDFAGTKVLAGTLQPGQRAPMQTYTTHAWMIADGSDQCMGTLMISKPGSIEVR